MVDKEIQISNDNKEDPSAEKQDPSDADIIADRDQTVDEQDVCEKAPEWAEHQRFQDDDDACDDGRSGRLGND